MHIIEMRITSTSAVPLAASWWYALLAEEYHLPTVADLAASLDGVVDWSAGPTQVYYVENMRDDQQNGRHVFSLRWLLTERSRDYTNIHISLEGVGNGLPIVHQMTIRFPACGSLRASSEMVGMLCLLLKEKSIGFKEVDVSIDGWMETVPRFVHEKYLGGMVWHDVIRRYLHSSEYIDRVLELERRR